MLVWEARLRALPLRTLTWQSQELADVEQAPAAGREGFLLPGGFTGKFSNTRSPNTRSPTRAFVLQ